MKFQALGILAGVLGAAVILGTGPSAQESATGKLKVQVNPEEAYTFVDGRAYGPGNHTIVIPAGDHTVLIANYGFTSHTEDVSVEPDGISKVQADLQRSGGNVSGPRGRIQIETGGKFSTHAAVLLNGKKTGYFVGHVDEFNNELITRQELIVPPGKHLVTITFHDQEIWSGMVEVGENQRVIVDASNGMQRVKQWDRGKTLGDLPRFKAGIASATVVVAPVTGSITANPPVITCGQKAQLAWNSTEAVDADISGFSPVPLNGARAVSPTETTTYEFTAMGPGGVKKSNATVQVDPGLNASLETSPAEVRYHRIGDKVVEQGSTTLTWKTENTEVVTIGALGTVPAIGTQAVKPVPAQTKNGAVDENVKYILTAKNACGGTEAKTATVHLTGFIEGIPGMTLYSVFYPTDYPQKANPSLGLLRSQREELTAIAAEFTKHLEFEPDARLALVAHADTRGAARFNLQLAERRAELVKGFLISQGIPEDKISVTAVGEEQPLSQEAVAQLESLNPNPAPAARARDAAGMQYAYQRRVDITLLPANTESKRFFPNNAPDSQLLWQKLSPSKKVLEKEQ